MTLTALILSKRGKLKQSLLYRAVVIHVNGVLKHIVYKVGIGFDEVIQDLQDFEILLLSLIESTKSHIISVEINSQNTL